MDDRRAEVREYLLGLLDKALPETACYETVNFRELRNLLEASVELQIECAERSTRSVSEDVSGASDEAAGSTEGAETIQETETNAQTELNEEDEKVQEAGKVDEVETNEAGAPIETESAMSEEERSEEIIPELPEEAATPKERTVSPVTSPRSSIPEQEHEENEEEIKEDVGHLKVVIKVPKDLVCHNREQTEFEFSVRDSHQAK